MRNKIKISGIVVIIMIFTLIINNNSLKSSNGNLDLASLTKINVANAENNIVCFNTYELGGVWIYRKCITCTEVAHIKNTENASTCSEN